MSQVTYYVALPFRYVDGEMVAGEPQEVISRPASKVSVTLPPLASDGEEKNRAVAVGRRRCTRIAPQLQSWGR